MNIKDEKGWDKKLNKSQRPHWKNRNHLRKKVVEEGEEVKAQLDPAFSIHFAHFIIIHYGGRIIDAVATHHRTICVTVK